MIRGIHHIALHTANFDRMVRFYREGFGFQPVGAELRWDNVPAMDRGMGLRASAGRILMLKAGNCFIEMFEFFSPAARDVPPLRPHDHGYTHFCVDVTDLAAECTRLEALGMSFEGFERFDEGDTKAAYGRDPDGNIIELMETAADASFDLSRLDGFDFRRATQ